MFKNKRAFTLIELLVVIAIIGLLATISVIALNDARAKARDAKRVADVKQMQTALELFFNDEGRYPTEDEFNSGSIFSTSTNGTTTYMAAIPATVAPADGSCTSTRNNFIYQQAENGGSYALSFCLGGATGSLASGEKCASPDGIVNDNCGFFLQTFLIGGSGNEYLNKIYYDSYSGSYYAAGQTNSEGYGDYDFLLLKMDSRLKIVAKKDLGNSTYNSIKSMTSDKNYLYAIGMDSGGEQYVLKFDKNLNLIAGVKYSNSGYNGIYDIKIDGDYLYLAGAGLTNTGAHTMISVFNKNDLSLVNYKFYGYTPNSENFLSLCVDNSNIYAVGAYNNGYGDAGAILYKMNKSDLNFVSSKIYGAGSSASFASVYCDNSDSSIYIGGSTGGEGQGGYDGVVLKVAKSDLSLEAKTAVGTAAHEYINQIAVSGDYIYGIGSSGVYWAGTDKGLLVKFNRSDLSLVYSKFINNNNSPATDNYLNSVVFNDGYLYAVGDSMASFGAGNYDAWLVKIKDKDKIGSFDSLPPGFTYSDAGLVSVSNTNYYGNYNAGETTGSIWSSTYSVSSQDSTLSQTGNYVILLSQ